MENRRGVGILGFVALVAVLTVSMLAVNLTTHPAQAVPEADNPPANKVNGYYGDFAVAIKNTEGFIQKDAYLAGFFIKTSDKNDWLIDMSMECATANKVLTKKEIKEAKKLGTLLGAKASAQVYMTYTDSDGNKSFHDTVWNVCSQDLQLGANLNDLIARCTQDDIDALKCDQIDEPFFVCSLDEAIEEPDECAQSVEVYLETAGAYNVKWILMDVPHGVYKIELWASLETERTAGGFEVDVATNPAQQVESAVFLNQGLVYATPIHMAVGADPTE